MPSLLKHQRLCNRFTLIRTLGTGGMGQVWLAQDNELGEHCALKVLKPELSASPTMVELLKNECRNTRRLVHPHIVRIFDFHRFEQWAFISMEYVDGVNLKQLTRRHYIEVLATLLPVIDALIYAHSLGIVHRDLKASNVLCDTTGKPYVVDFGIADAMDTQMRSIEMLGGGSLYSVSPQQLNGAAAQPADDIYSLGVLLYELLLGQPPFYPHISAEKIENETPDCVTGNAQLPNRLTELMLQLLAKTPQQRPASMAAVKAEFLAIQAAGEDLTVPPSAPVPMSTPDAEASNIDIIPPQIPPLSRAAEENSHKRKGISVIGVLLSFALAVLLAAGVVVFYFLPQLVEKRQILSRRNVQAGITNPPQTERAAETERRAWLEAAASRAQNTTPQESPHKERAEQVMGVYLQKQAALEQAAVAQWGGEQYSSALLLATEGDELLRAKDFGPAADAYENAVALLDKVESRKQEILKTAIERGTQALESGNSAEANEAFTQAQQLAPNNEVVAKGLARAETLERVFSALRSGHNHEQANALELALVDYQQAVALDPEMKQAQEAVERVNNKLVETKFQTSMSAGLAALHAGNFSRARDAFQTARTLKPDSRELKDAFIQLEEGVRLVRIERFRAKAMSLENEERFREAAEQYIAILKLDNSLIFAKEGKFRTLQQANLSDQIQGYLNQPKRLASRSVYEQALKDLQRASRIENKGPKLTAQIAAFETTVKTAGTPIRVAIQSDNLTDVAVYKVGRLGKFKSRELRLRPGTYTIVGSRDGYRDVRRQITVVAGKAAIPVVIRCEDKI